MINFLDDTYNHKMTVIRNVETTINNFDKFVPSNIYINVPCAVSRTKSGYNANQTISKNEIKYSLTLFCNPVYIVETGDSINVTFENGQIKKYKAGEGFYYPDHAEIPLLREGEA